MVETVLKKEKTSSIGSSPDLKFISNENFGKSGSVFDV
jgi:hypothetical protein